MKLSMLALLAVATAQAEVLGGPISDKATFPSGTDDSKHGAAIQEENPPAPENEEPQPEPTPPTPEDPTPVVPEEDPCEKNGRYRGRPTPCDGKWVDHVTIIPNFLPTRNSCFIFQKVAA